VFYKGLGEKWIKIVSLETRKFIERNKDELRLPERQHHKPHKEIRMNSGYLKDWASQTP
jgi:hypothetical protein